MPRPIRVLLCDDHALVREGLQRILEGAPDIFVVGEASNGDEAMRLAGNSRPDVVVLDYTMPGSDATQIAAQLRRDLPNTRILVLTMHEDVHYALKILQAGAHGYATKAVDGEEIRNAIRSVHAGRGYISPSMVPRLASHLTGPGDRLVGLDSLSQREFQVLRLMGAGLSLHECAQAMGLSESSVSTYRARLMAKLNLPTSAAVIRYAIEHGIVG